MKIKKSKIVSEVNGIEIDDIIENYDFGRVVSFWQKGGKWYADVRDDNGAGSLLVKEDGLYYDWSEDGEEDELCESLESIRKNNGR